LLRQWGRNDHQKIQSTVKLPVTIGKKNVAGVAGLVLLDAVETDFGFDIEIYKT
jgi:hypothetical protein